MVVIRRIIEVEKEYRVTGQKAIDKFFKKHRELDYWKEHIQYMLENGIDFSSDNIMADGTKNKDWAYALHLDVEDYYTYICIIERE